MWEWGMNGPVAALGVVTAVAGGLAVALVRTRRRWRRALGERGWLLERERESAARAAIAAERDRIARELHDIVSHNVSLMVVQAGAAREVLGTMPDEAAAALLAVEDAGRGAMTDLRHLLGLLAPSQNGEEPEEDPDARETSGAQEGADRDADMAGADAADAGAPVSAEAVAGAGSRAEGGVGAGRGAKGGAVDEAGCVERGAWPESAELTPQPGLDRLGPLVDRVSFAGLPVEVRISGEPRPLPQGIDVTAYRIVQEALTNALRHGDGGRAEVTVRYADRALRVEVLNTGPSVLTGAAPAPSPPTRPAPRHPRGTGRGLLGLRERVAVYGGDLDARRRLGGGYRVRARIPLDRP
ncbi:sensor histidine kinase [Streptomyces caniscabiei]|uniref:histidine kinase n=3 Tax=Streptomyces caniscabiei TaxID=2746961 RepID=A0ABU4MX57_9ACTN|nr:histidine kinase [Streptomyces caniscabiei]MDX2946761.1 histidine kinase [Streptomyces caniscabiei]MDX2990085.1 histidine kinase [Streptomyces caniscabiei]MDX3014308.1 histidine kinase [Streptomyces caniscabiei]MDX3040969.1 histidine kinase [Streptomyces caniscabiei]